MTTLNTLNLVAMSKIGVRDPKLQRRHKLITQLEQQRSLAVDSIFVVPRQRWVKQENGDKQLVYCGRREGHA